MAIKLTSGDIFVSRAQALVNPVNCRGAMGRGLAAEFKRRWPEMFADYKNRCNTGSFRPGLPYIWKGQGAWIINFPTKDDWRKPSRLEWIDAGLAEVARCYQTWGLDSVAMPALGAGLGGLEWAKVFPLIEAHLQKTDLEVIVYGPHEA